MASDTFTGADHDTLDDDTADALETLAELTERQDPRPARFSRHARRRAARRNLLPDAVDCVLTHGRCLYRTGVTFYLLARRDLPPADRRASWAARLEGTVILVAPDGEVITVYRNRRAPPTIRRKMKYQLARPEAPDIEPPPPDVADVLVRLTA
jgi:hypothetical protein